MRRSHHVRFRCGLLGLVFVFCAFAGGAIGTLSTAFAQSVSADDRLAAVVRIKTFINPDDRTVENLGREREGAGIVIDNSGLILTIGYVMVEAHSAEVTTNDGRSTAATVVGYDHDTGFGLLRAIEPLRVTPMPLGRSASLKVGDPVLVASFGGPAMAGAVQIVGRREFAGAWEYLLEDAIFTAPAHPLWSGAALINREGRLVGVGSLVVGDAANTGGPNAGNMFIPIDALPPILADLIADGRKSSAARPWLGLTTTEAGGRLVITRAVPGGPAEKAGITRGAVIVGVNGEKPTGLADFYRRVWAQGRAGVSIPVEVTQQNETRRIDIPSIDRLEHLRLKSTF